MNMPIPLPVQLSLSQPQRFTVPPVLRRALLYCMAALLGALLLWVLSAVWHAEAETERNDARAGMQKTASLLTSALDAEAARTARAKRFALVRGALGSALPGKSEWERLTAQIEAYPHIVEPTLSAQPVQPAFPAPEHVSNVILSLDDKVSKTSVYGTTGSPEPYQGIPDQKNRVTQKLPVIALQRVRIEAGLLHEEALLALDAIAGGSSAHVIPTGCSLQREADAAPVALRANCEFEWITLVPSPE